MQNPKKLMINMCRMRLDISFRPNSQSADFSAGHKTMPFLIRARHWRAFANGEVGVQINKQQGLKESQEDYIQMQAIESERQAEQLAVPYAS